MAKLPDLRRILREDLGSDVPEYIDKIIGPVNSFSEAIYQALAKQITFSENISASLRTLEIVTSATYPADFAQTEVYSGLSRRADGVIILQIQNKANPYAPVTTSPFISWLDLDGNIKITHVSGLTASTTYILKILVI